MERDAYIEIVAEVTWTKGELQHFDLWNIGEFTRENVASWLDRCGGPVNSGMWEYGYVDFHAVCGDIDIPWADEWNKRYFKP